MKVSLRQARRIERDIAAILNQNEDLAIDLKISVYDNVLETLKKVERKVFDDLDKNKQLLNLRYFLRKEIESKNELTGLNKLMNNDAFLKARLKSLNAVINFGATAEDINLVVKRHETLSNQYATGAIPVSRFGDQPDIVRVEKFISDLSHVKEEINSIKRELVSNTEAQAELNSVTKIDIDDVHVKMLESFNIVVG